MNISQSEISNLKSEIPHFTTIPLPNNTVLQKPAAFTQPIAHQPSTPQENPPETRPEPASNPPPTNGQSTPNPPQTTAEPASGRPSTAPKRGPVGHLFTLPHETQEEILTLLCHHTESIVRAHLAKPKPTGHGITVSQDALGRFKKHHQQRRARERHQELADEARAILSLSDSDQDFTHSSLRLLKAQLLETATQPDLPLDQLEKLHRILNRIRLTDLAEKRLTHDKSKNK